MAFACLILAFLGVPNGFTEAPAFVPLFTPRAVPPGTYRTYTTVRDLDSILAAIRDDPSLARANGSFEPQSVIAADAFGQSGGYNRWRLALLYGAKRARVARGPRLDAGRVVEAWTLVSPYPDPGLERLNAGTLLIILRLQP
jgi:pimeloyl-ACP methyl ester carboxylesterase